VPPESASQASAKSDASATEKGQAAKPGPAAATPAKTPVVPEPERGPSKGDQVVLVLLCVMGAVLLAVIGALAVFFIRRGILGVHGDTDSPYPERASNFQKIGALVLGGAILIGVLIAGFKAWKWATGEFESWPVALMTGDRPQSSFPELNTRGRDPDSETAAS
jgi:hypothetical protein